jgi:hypothetical protein
LKKSLWLSIATKGTISPASNKILLFAAKVLHSDISCDREIQGGGLNSIGVSF